MLRAKKQKSGLLTNHAAQMLQPIRQSAPTYHRRLASCRAYVLMLGLLLYSVAAAGAFALTQEQQAWLEDHPRIRIGINNAWPPMDYQDLEGKPRGIGVRLIQALNRRLGGRLEVVPGAWKEIYNGVRERRLDALLDITPLPDREADFNFTTPYIRIPHVIFTNEDTEPIINLAQLAGKSVGLEQGFFLVDQLRKSHPEIRVKTYPDTSSALGAVARHEVDAYIGNRAVAMHIIRNELLTGIRATGRVDISQSINAIGVRKDWPVLRDILQRALDDIGDDERSAIMDLDRLTVDGHEKSRNFLRSLSIADRQWLMENSPISVGVMDTWPPFSFLDENGEPAGISIGYLQALNDRLGNVLTPVPGEWSRIYDDVAAKRLDVIMDITPKPSREPLFNFTTPYLDIPHVIVARKEVPFIASESELTGKRLALERGFGNVGYFRQHYPDIELKLYANTLSALEAVSRGDADAYAGNRAVALYLIDKHFLTNLRIHGALNKSGSILALGVRKDWPRLRDILQRALDGISVSERRYLTDRWVDEIDDREPGVTLTPAQRGWLDKHPEIPVGIDGNWPPIDFLDKQGRHAGITSDYLHLLEKRLGIRFIPKKFGSFKEMLEQVKSGDPPVGATIAYNAERAGRLIYTAPFFNAHEVIVVREENQHLRHIEDLIGHTVAMEDGFVTTTTLREKYPGIKHLPVNDTLSALQKVSWGEADAYVGNQAVATWLIRNNQLDNLVVTGDAGLGSHPQHFVVSRLAPEYKPLIGIIDTALSTIPESERLQIEKRWLGNSPATGLAPVKLTEKERLWLLEHKSIRLGVDSSWPPMEFIDENGEYKGISRDYMELLGRQLGINWVEPGKRPWEEVLKGIREKTLDVIPLLSANRERESYISFTKPLVNTKVVVFNRRGEAGIDDLNELDGKRVAVVKGYSVTVDLQRDFPGIVPDPYDSVSEALHAVSEGRSEAFVGILPVAGYIIGKEGLSNLQVAGATKYTKSFSMAVRKDWPELVGILNKAIDTLDDATRNRIVQRWTTVEFKQKTDYTLVIQILAVLFLIVLVGSIWIGQIKRANRALSESRERLALALQAGQLGSWEAFLDPNNKLRMRIDSTGCSQLGLVTQQDEISLQDFLAAIAEEYRAPVAQQIEQYLAGTRPDIELEYRTGKDRWLHVRGRSLQQDPAGKPRQVIGIALDITERKQAHQALEQANRFKSEFLANMSHEIRTPMNAVIGLAHLLGKTPLTPRQRDYTHKIQLSAQSLLGVIDDILDFSKIEAGKLSIEKQPFDFEDILENISILAQTRLVDKPVELLYELSPDIPKQMIGDVYRINQILTNLVSNAIKFTERGSIVVSARIKKRKAQEVLLQFEVRDTGIGIPEDKLDSLFDAFIQADGSTTRRFGGTGLGLSISQKLCSLMGGKISVESQEEAGSVFRVELPLKPLEGNGLIRVSDDLRGRKILLVEDNPTAQEVISNLLRSLTHQVTVVSTGAEALTRLADPDEHFDLLFIDWRLPGMDGDEVARAVHEIYGDDRPIIILITAYGREIKDHPISETHIDGLLIKPLTPSLVNDAIMEAYGIHRPSSFELENHRPRETQFAGKVLLAEDNEINRQVAVELLQHLGVDVDTVPDGEMAVQAVERDRPDLVFLDIQMPVMDGYETVRKIRALPGMADLPIYAMTANALVGDAEKSLAAGMDGHITKPIDPERLIEVLALHLPTQTKTKSQADHSQVEDRLEIPNPCPSCINIRRGIKMVGGSSDFYLQLLRNFLERHGDCAETMKQLIADSRLEEARREAHTLKGVSSNIGAKELHREAAALEHALRHGEPPRELVERFADTAHELFSALRKITAASRGTDKGDHPPDQAEPVPQQEMIEKLIVSLQNGEARSVKLYRELQSHIKQQLDPGDFLRLQSMIEDYELESAADLLQTTMKG